MGQHRSPRKSTLITWGCVPWPAGPVDQFCLYFLIDADRMFLTSIYRNLMVPLQIAGEIQLQKPPMMHGDLGLEPLRARGRCAVALETVEHKPTSTHLCLYPPLQASVLQRHLTAEYLITQDEHTADGKSVGTCRIPTIDLRLLPSLCQFIECVAHRLVHLRPIDQAHALSVVFPGRRIHSLSFS